MLKKGLRFIIVLSLMVTSISSLFIYVDADYKTIEEKQLNLTFNFDSNNLKFSINGIMPDNINKYANIIIYPHDKEISKQGIMDPSVIIRTVGASRDGNLSANIILPSENYLSRYTFHVNVNNFGLDGVFTTAKESDMTLCLDEVNSASDSSSIKSALTTINNKISRNDMTEEEFDYITSYIFKMRPKTGYTGQTLIDAYLCADGMCLFKNAKINIEDYLIGYRQYIGRDYYGLYSNLTEVQKISFCNALRQNDAVCSFEKNIYDNIFVAKYISSANVMELQNYARKYFEDNFVNMETFNSISNEYYKEKVFDNMYAEKSNITDVASIIENFQKNSLIQKQNSYISSNNQSGGSFGGGISGSVSKVPTTGDIWKDKTNDINDKKDGNVYLSDINKHWAEKEIEKLCTLGIINGFEDGTFRPEQNVTRAEFAKIIAIYLELNPKSNNTFLDVSLDSWYNEYVSALSEKNIVYGTEGYFEPDKEITRQDVAVILSRVLDYKKISMQESLLVFDDKDEISDYAKTAVGNLYGIGIIKGYNGKFMPDGKATRAEAVAMLTRIIEYIG